MRERGSDNKSEGQTTQKRSIKSRRKRGKSRKQKHEDISLARQHEWMEGKGLEA